MILDSRAIALDGIGYSSRSVALFGLWMDLTPSISAYQPNKVFLVGIVDIATKIPNNEINTQISNSNNITSNIIENVSRTSLYENKTSTKLKINTIQIRLNPNNSIISNINNNTSIVNVTTDNPTVVLESNKIKINILK